MTSVSNKDVTRSHSWSKDSILHDYRVALESRFTDDIEEIWKNAGRIKFDILGAGQEIAQICAVRSLKPGDWMRGYYRGFAEALHTRTTTVREALAQVLGNTEAGCDPASGGRMMGRHFGSRLLDDDGELVDLLAQINRGSDVSPTGSQLGPALGLALASRVFENNSAIGERYPGLSAGGGEVVHVSIGDASMSEGIALESIFQAVVQRVPLVLSVYDNGFGISVPIEQQTPNASISRALSGLASKDGTKVFGPIHDWDYAECRRTYEEAYDWVRTHRVPVIVHAMVTQPRGHSSSGDHRRYKSAERLQFEMDHDGVKALREWIVTNDVATAGELDAIESDARGFVTDESEVAWSDYYAPIVAIAEEAIELIEGLAAAADAPLPDVNDMLARLRAGAKIEVKQQFLTRSLILEDVRALLMATVDSLAGHEARARLLEFRERVQGAAIECFGSELYATGAKSPCEAPFVPPVNADKPRKDTGAHIIAAGVATLMAQDPRVVTFGEDTGELGGVTTCSIGLQGGTSQVLPEIWNRSPALVRYVPESGFGKARVWDTAIAENSIVGTAAGLALRGLRPIAEIQYHDYANYGVQQLSEELACLRHRTDGGQESPAIVWCQGHRLLGMWHSGSPMGMFLTIPGLRVLVPRDAIQAVGMYRALITHGRDPAFVVVPLLDLYNKLPVPENLDEVCVPLGQSEVLRSGDQLTVVTYGHCCSLAQRAAKEVEELFGLSVEVVDLQTLNPLDLNGVAQGSIEKTGRVLFFDEDYPNGAMAMVSKAILHDRMAADGNQVLYYLESVRTLTSPDHKPCYGEDGGYFSKPQVYQIVEALVGLWNDSLPRGATALQVPWAGSSGD
ncbi:MAG: thiamine pyrophosphate-dependent enzyme [bacterium]|nr:thiamine pyrophosphate-dependent enzyme [bacterium]